MSTPDICQMHPTVPSTESHLCQELQAYYEAIQSYPEYFARSRVGFQQHLLNVICADKDNRAAANPSI
jgi:hypothetical protein